jgi:hypothetical protein
VRIRDWAIDSPNPTRTRFDPQLAEGRLSRAAPESTDDVEVQRP